LLLRGFVGIEDRRKFNITHRADNQAVGAQAVKQLRRGNTEARVGLGHINQ